MNLLRKSFAKSVSILLSFIMIMNLFTIVPLSVGAENGTHTLTVESFEPSILNDHYENIAIETKINGSIADGSSHSVTAAARRSSSPKSIPITPRWPMKA